MKPKKRDEVGPPIYEAWVKVKKGLFTVEIHTYDVMNAKEALKHLVEDLRTEECDKIIVDLKPTGGVR